MKAFLLVFFYILLCFGFSARSQVAVCTYHNDNYRTGANTNETLLTPANVNATTFGKLFSYPVDGLIYTQPLYVPNVAIPGRGLHNVFYVASQHNTVYAFDADSSGGAGGLLWKTNLGPSAVTTIAGVFTNQNFGTRPNGVYTDIVPEVGITGTPVIDTNTGTLYVDAFTGEIGGGGTNYFHRLHALKITDGTEQPYSPVVVAASVAGVGLDSTNGLVYFNAQQQLQRCALTLAGGIVYVAYAGYQDTDPYHGWIIGYRATNLVQLTNYVFNTTPNSTVPDFGGIGGPGEGGIWMAGGGLSVDANTNIYFETGNGAFTATNNSGGTEYGDSFVKLSTVNGLSVADYFTPYNQLFFQSADIDLGSGGVLLLPDQPGNAHVMIGSGKAGIIYVLNRDQLTIGNNHFNAGGSTDAVLQTDAVRLNNKAAFFTPAYFNGSIYMAASGDNLKRALLTNGLLATTTISDAARTFSSRGATPSISANANNNGIVWALAYNRTSPALLVACDATTMTELYTSTNASGGRDALANGVKFAVPTVADGKVLVGNSNSVSVFGLLAGAFAFDAPTYSVPEANTVATIGVNRLGGTTGAVSVSYATVAGGTATSGLDYSSAAGTLSWANGEGGTKYFTVPILADAITDPNETVNLALSNPTGNAALGSSATAVLTIVEAPSTNSATLVFDAATYSIPETNSPAVIGVIRNGSTSGAVSAFYATVAGGTAVSGTNYISANGTLNWASGDGTTKYFTIPILNDNQANGNRTVNLALTILSGSAALGSPSNAVLTINDTAAASPTSAWKLAHFGSNANNASISGDTADPDNDRIPNLLEYACATDPNVSNTSPFTGVRLGGNLFQLRLPRNTIANDVVYVVQTATTLNSWSDLITYTPGPGWQATGGGWSVSESGTFGAAPDQFVNVTITSLTNVAGGGATSRFFRLQIHR